MINIAQLTRSFGLLCWAALVKRYFEASKMRIVVWLALFMPLIGSAYLRLKESGSLLGQQRSAESSAKSIFKLDHQDKAKLTLLCCWWKDTALRIDITVIDG